MPACIQEPESLDDRYRFVDMHQINCAGLLVQDNPDALVLAVLCDFGDREPGEVVGCIAPRLRELLVDDERRFREYMAMLEILSDNRALRSQVEEAERMLTEVDVERLPSFVIGYEHGEAKGEAVGEARGKAEGQELATQQIVRRLLTRMVAAQAAELLDLEVETFQRIASADESHR